MKILSVLSYNLTTVHGNHTLRRLALLRKSRDRMSVFPLLIPSHDYLIQNSQAVKKVCGLQKGYGEKRCEIQGGGQEMAVMVG